LAWASLFLIETVLPPSCPRVRSLRRALPFPESSSSCRARQRDADADSHVDATWLRSNLSRVPIADFPASPEALETCVKARLPRRFRAATEAPGTRWASLLARCANYSWLMEKTAARARIPILVVPEPEATTSSSNTNGSSSLRKGDPSGTSEGPWRSRIPGFFNGSEDERREATLPFHGLLEFAKAREEGRTHFSEKFGTRMYLSQCPVLAGATCEQQGWETHRGVSGIIENRGDLPEILEGKHVCSVNLWLGVDPTVTSAHYDCHDNLLCVSRGRKIALLLPPSLKTQRFLRPRSVAARTPNDSPRTPSELLEIAERLSRDIENSPGVSGDDNTEIPRPMLAVLDPGESLFIPEGWWHQVSSSPLTTALNVFFYGHLLPPPPLPQPRANTFRSQLPPPHPPLTHCAPRCAPGLPRAHRLSRLRRPGIGGNPGTGGGPSLEPLSRGHPRDDHSPPPGLLTATRKALHSAEVAPSSREHPPACCVCSGLAVLCPRPGGERERRGARDRGGPTIRGCAQWALRRHRRRRGSPAQHAKARVPPKRRIRL